MLLRAEEHERNQVHIYEMTNPFSLSSPTQKYTDVAFGRHVSLVYLEPKNEGGIGLPGRLRHKLVEGDEEQMRE